MATITDLTGYTWVGNDELNVRTSELGKWKVDFVSNDTDYATFNVNDDGVAILLKYDDTTVYTDDDAAIKAWTDTAYKTIQITGGADATNTDFIAWLQENGTLTKAGPTYKHYYDVGMVGTGDVRFRHYSATELTQLATPTNLAISDTTVSWDEVTNAESYDVYVDGEFYANTEGGCSSGN